MKYENMDIDIRDVQKAQLEILLEFDRVCKKNDINYQLFAGTLLGAIRHKGFIPWDDDIDVCMTREDYSRFLVTCEKDLDSKFFLQTYETDKNYMLQFAKIRKNNSIFLEEDYSDCDIHQGFYIDVFALDNVKPNTFSGLVQRKTFQLLRKINRARVKKLCLKSESFIVKNTRLILYYLLKFIPKSWTDKLQTRIATMFKYEETKYITHLLNGVHNNRYEKYLMEKENFNKTIVGDFEGYKFPIPENYDVVLSRLFGDYKKLPPVEVQKPHHGVIEVKFNLEKGETNNEKI